MWNQNVKLLPIHFAASAIASAAAILTLMGHDDAALNDIAIGAAAIETLIGAAIEMRRNAALAPLREGASGWMIRAGGVLSGPVPLLCRAAGALADGGERCERGGARRLDTHASRLDCGRPRISEGVVMLPLVVALTVQIATGLPNLAGTWTLDAALSDPPEQVARELREDTGSRADQLFSFESGPSGRSGQSAEGRGRRGTQTPRPSKPNPIAEADRKLLEELTAAVQFPPTTLAISQTNSDVTIGGQTLHADGKSDTRQIEGGSVERTTAWEGPLLTIRGEGQARRHAAHDLLDCEPDQTARRSRELRARRPARPVRGQAGLRIPHRSSRRDIPVHRLIKRHEAIRAEARPNRAQPPRARWTHAVRGQSTARLHDRPSLSSASGGHRNPVTPSLDHFGQSADARRHHRHLARHRLERREAEALLRGRQQKEVGD